MSARKALGSLIGFVGVVICVTGGSVSSLLEGSFRMQGEGAVLASAFCGAMASNLIKKTFLPRIGNDERLAVPCRRTDA
jgi:drug/metabolite transporter (DMT)-like permease